MPCSKEFLSHWARFFRSLSPHRRFSSSSLITPSALPFCSSPSRYLALFLSRAGREMKLLSYLWLTPCSICLCRTGSLSPFIVVKPLLFVCSKQYQSPHLPIVLTECQGSVSVSLWRGCFVAARRNQLVCFFSNSDTQKKILLLSLRHLFPVKRARRWC